MRVSDPASLLPHETGRPLAAGELVSAARTALAALFMTVGFVTLSPFAASYAGSASGNVLNQLGYGLFGLAALVGHVLFTDRRVAASLLRPSWLLLLLWLAVSTRLVADSTDALRGVVFTAMAMTIMTGALCLPPDGRSFRFGLIVAAGTAIGLSYIRLALRPDLARHVGDDHSGLWRGIYNHKNVAGAAMAVFFFVGVYLLRFRHWLLGSGLAVLSAFFVLHTGSKTSLGLIGVVLLVVLSGRFTGFRVLPVVGALLALAGAALLTIGSAVIPWSNELVQSVAPGTTFTGRYEIWQMGFTALANRGWEGFGFGGFWLNPILAHYEVPIEFKWDPRGTVNGHNGYLDLALFLGWPGLILALWVLLVAPLRAYLRAGANRESAVLADFFLMTLLFLLLNALLESFFFERANPLWMMTWLAVAGLNLIGRYRLS